MIYLNTDLTLDGSKAIDTKIALWQLPFWKLSITVVPNFADTKSAQATAVSCMNESNTPYEGLVIRKYINSDTILVVLNSFTTDGSQKVLIDTKYSPTNVTPNNEFTFIFTRLKDTLFYTDPFNTTVKRLIAPINKYSGSLIIGDCIRKGEMMGRKWVGTIRLKLEHYLDLDLASFKETNLALLYKRTFLIPIKNASTNQETELLNITDLVLDGTNYYDTNIRLWDYNNFRLELIATPADPNTLGVSLATIVACMNEIGKPYDGFVIRNYNSYKTLQFVFNSKLNSIFDKRLDVPSPYVVNIILEKNRNLLRYTDPKGVVYTATITGDLTSDSHLCIGNVLQNTTWMSRQWIGTINSLKLTIF